MGYLPMQWHIHEIQQNEEDKRDEFKGKTFFDVEGFYSGGDLSGCWIWQRI